MSAILSRHQCVKWDAPSIILYALLDLYKKQTAVAYWTGYISEPFSATNGIRQVGVIFLIRFNVYMDEPNTRKLFMWVPFWKAYMENHMNGIEDYQVMKWRVADIWPTSLKSYEVQIFLNLKYPRHIRICKCVNELFHRNYNQMKIQLGCKYFVNEICFNVSFAMHTNSRVRSGATLHALIPVWIRNHINYKVWGAWD